MADDPPKSIDATAIGERIRLARREAGLTQRELAERIDVIERSVQNYETGRIPWKKLSEIADVTGREKEWLLYGDVGAEAAPSADAILERLDRIEAALRDLIAKIEGLTGPVGTP